MLAIFVTIRIQPGRNEEFMQASLADAQGSVRHEPGCFRFDILRDPANPNRVYLYEIYRDEAAFEAHRETPHFKKWLETVEKWFDGELEWIRLETVFPSEQVWESQKPGLQNW